MFKVDITIPFDNRPAAFEAAAETKKVKYDLLRTELLAKYPGEVLVVPFIVGALGSWDPRNDSFLRRICSRKYASLMG